MFCTGEATALKAAADRRRIAADVILTFTVE
jgi:hypothetical protein